MPRSHNGLADDASWWFWWASPCLGWNPDENLEGPEHPLFEQVALYTVHRCWYWHAAHVALCDALFGWLKLASGANENYTASTTDTCKFIARRLTQLTSSWDAFIAGAWSFVSRGACHDVQSLSLDHQFEIQTWKEAAWDAYADLPYGHESIWLRNLGHRYGI